MARCTLFRPNKKNLKGSRKRKSTQFDKRSSGRPGKFKVTSVEVKITVEKNRYYKAERWEKQSCNSETCSRTNFRSLARFQTLRGTTRHIWKVHLGVLLCSLGYKMGQFASDFFASRPGVSRCLISMFHHSSVGRKCRSVCFPVSGLDFIALHFRRPILAARYKIRGLRKCDYIGG